MCLISIEFYLVKKVMFLLSYVLGDCKLYYYLKIIYIFCYKIFKMEGFFCVN